jgi:hypothetical protein
MLSHSATIVAFTLICYNCHRREEPMTISVDQPGIGTRREESEGLPSLNLRPGEKSEMDKKNIGYTAEELERILSSLLAAGNVRDDLEQLEKLFKDQRQPLNRDEIMELVVTVKSLIEAIPELLARNNQKIIEDLKLLK